MAARQTGYWGCVNIYEHSCLISKHNIQDSVRLDLLERVAHVAFGAVRAVPPPLSALCHYHSAINIVPRPIRTCRGNIRDAVRLSAMAITHLYFNCTRCLLQSLLNLDLIYIPPCPYTLRSNRYRHIQWRLTTGKQPPLRRPPQSRRLIPTPTRVTSQTTGPLAKVLSPPPQLSVTRKLTGPLSPQWRHRVRQLPRCRKAALRDHACGTEATPHHRLPHGLPATHAGRSLFV